MKNEQKAYPKIGEVFELTLDGSDPRVQPEVMAENYHLGITGWRYNGDTEVGIVTCRFKLISIGYYSSWPECLQKLMAEGKIPHGQWLEAFVAKFPEHDCKGPIGVADASWLGVPAIDAFFPRIHFMGGLDFRFAGRDFKDFWRWLIEVE